MRWEYRRIDLNDVPRKGSEVDLLCRAGAAGWELVVVFNGLAYLKRPLPADEEDDNASKASSEAAPKYRDPATGETWSGRGRMPRWLKAKQDAGENLDTYRV